MEETDVHCDYEDCECPRCGRKQLINFGYKVVCDYCHYTEED